MGTALSTIFSSNSGGVLSEFQKSKILFDFDTFIDLNKDGILTELDMEEGKERICRMSGWKRDSKNYHLTDSLFKQIWENMKHTSDIDNDGKITRNEWLLMWVNHFKELSKTPRSKNRLSYSKPVVKNPNAIPTTATANSPANMVKAADTDKKDSMKRSSSANDTKKESKNEKMARRPFSEEENYENGTQLQQWLFDYLVFRFNLLDRTGDKVIDREEFVYVLSEFGISERESHQAFTMFSKNENLEINFEYFLRLFEQYYLSNNPSDLGNFINGKLEFNYHQSNNNNKSP